MSELHPCQVCGTKHSADDLEHWGGIFMCARCVTENKEMIATCDHTWEAYEGGECEPGFICGKCCVVKEAPAVTFLTTDPVSSGPEWDMAAAQEKIKKQDAQIEQLQEIIRELIDLAMPSNWDDLGDRDHTKAWENAIISQGEDPADYRD